MAVPVPPVVEPGLDATHDGAAVAARRPGQLTLAWRVLTAVMWGLVFVAFTGVWKASRELGLATWWLGPISAPRPVVVVLAPLYLPSMLVIAALNNARWLPWLGLAASAATAAVGLADLGHVFRLGVVEVAIAAAGAVFSLASSSGAYRRA